MGRSMEEKRLIIKMMKLKTKKLTLEKWNEFKGGIEKLYRNRQKKGLLKRHSSQLFRCLEKCKIDDEIDLTLFSEYQKEIVHTSENQIVPNISVPGLPVTLGMSYYKKINKDSGTIWTGALARKFNECLSFIEDHAKTDDASGEETWEGVPIDILCRFPVNATVVKNNKSNNVDKPDKKSEDSDKTLNNDKSEENVEKKSEPNAQYTEKTKDGTIDSPKGAEKLEASDKASVAPDSEERKNKNDANPAPNFFQN